ncbi:MAG TPA: MoaD/ThiS family protein [Acidimicrobiia bacterium]|jgi:molybdopterin converting factor small subunit
MALVKVAIPSMLATLVKGDRRFEVEAATVAAVLDEIFGRHPELRVHVLDENGGLRRHVMLFLNDGAIRTYHRTVDDGDSVTILQAVSGG